MFNIDAILASTDLISLIERNGGKMTRNGHEWRGACILHGGDNTSAFVVWEEGGKQKWHCFTRSECGSGDAVDFMMKLHGCDFPTACRYLGGEDEPDPQAIQQAATARAKRAEEALQEKIDIAIRAKEDLQAAQSWVAYHEYLENNDELRRIWTKRGVTEDLQNWWQLGYRPSYRIKTEKGVWATPTITIPIFEPGWTCINVRHRLLNPYKPDDKYRPERAGLGATMFISDPDLGWNTDRVLVVEGEIKSMVAWTTLEDQGLQVVGIPGKKGWASFAEKLKGRDIWWLFDPGAEDEAIRAAKMLGGRIVTLSMKVDDAIIAGLLDKNGLRMRLKSARKL